MPKIEDSNATFQVIFKHCVHSLENKSPKKSDFDFLDQKKLFGTVCIDMVFFKNQAFRDRWWCRRSHKNRE